MVDYSQFSIVGGVFLFMAVCLIVGLMRESIPHRVRRGAQATLFLTVCGGAVWFASLKAGVRWPSWPGSFQTVAAEPQAPGTPAATVSQAKRKAVPAYSPGSVIITRPGTTQLRSGTLREVTPEEAARLLANRPK